MDPDPIYYFTLLGCEPLLVGAIRNKVDLPHHPGIYLGASLQAAAGVAQRDALTPGAGVEIPSRTFLHSVEGLTVPILMLFLKEEGYRFLVAWKEYVP